MKMNFDTVCNMINAYSGSKDEEDLIIKSIRPYARRIAQKHVNKPVLKLWHTVEDLEMLICLHLLKFIRNKKIDTYTPGYIKRVMFFGMIDGIRTEYARVRQAPNTAEYQVDFYSDSNMDGCCYLETDKIDFMSDLKDLRIPKVKKATSEYYKKLFYCVVFCNKCPIEAARIFNCRPETISKALTLTTKAVCKLYGSDFSTVRFLISNYNRMNVYARKRYDKQVNGL